MDPIQPMLKLHSMSQPAITPEFVSKALSLPNITALGTPNDQAQKPFSHVTSDSRKVTPGSLFVALVGENLDGHRFIQSAISSGATGILCQKGTRHPLSLSKPGTAPTSPISTSSTTRPASSSADPAMISDFAKTLPPYFFEVPDTLSAYRQLAAAWRREFSIPIVAVAGSAGKTTTKELLASLLAGKWPHVLKTQGSQNGFIGIPMTLLELRPKHQAAVIEVGIDEIGAMQQHMDLLQPTHAILTAIGPEHLVRLKDVPTIAHEEGIALAHTAGRGGTALINLDDPWISRHLETLPKSPRLCFSLHKQQDPPNSSPNTVEGLLHPGGRQLLFKGPGIQETSVALPLPGDHNAANLLGAIAVAISLGLTPREIQTGLQTFKGAEGRSEIRTFSNHITVICDYYNAQPASITAGIQLLSQLSKETLKEFPSSRRWACLGDMLELGPDEERFHRDLAKQILELEIEHVLLYGSLMAHLDDELKKQGYRGFRAKMSSHADLAQLLIQQIKPGDAILIKGSRGMKMEEVWKPLAHFLQPHSL